MTGNKLLIGSVLVFVVALMLGGIYYPNSLLMSLADPSMSYVALRAVIVALLIVLLVTRPPRTYTVRMLIGIGSVVLAALSFGALFSYEVRLLDAAVFLEVAIIFALESLEVRTIHVKEKYLPPKRIPVKTT